MGKVSHPPFMLKAQTTLRIIVLLFGLCLLSSCQTLQPPRPGTPSIKIETAVEAEGDQVGGVTQFPAGVYRPIGRTEGGTYYEFDKPLTAKLLADTVPTKGGLYVPDDPNRPALGWYNMPAGAPEAVIAPEQGTVGSYGGDPVAAANNPYDSADDTLMRHRVRLSSVPKFVEIPQ